MVPDLERVGDIIRQVAAAEIVPRFRRLGDGDIRQKGPGDLVTVADEATERALSAALTALVPGSLVIGEEAAASDSRVLSRIESDQPVWIIDPIDGTGNFVAGRETFAVIVALAVAGRTEAGWIYDPCTGRLATAQRGRGATLNGQRVTLPPPGELEGLKGVVSPQSFERRTREHLEARLPRLAGALNLHCAGHEYLLLLQGETQFSIYRRLMPWDHAAGVLLHGEAGGHAAKLDGAGYAPTDVAGGLLLAPSRESWTTLRNFLFTD